MTAPSANDPPGPGGGRRAGITRREAMQIGYSGLLGVGLTSALPARATAQDPSLKGSEKPESDRLTRTPRQLAEQLAAVYGNRLEQIAYIPALPLVAKLRLSELTGDPKHTEKVNALVAPFLRGEKSPVPKSGSEQAGHLLFAELAVRRRGRTASAGSGSAGPRRIRSLVGTASRCRSCRFTTR